MRPAVFFDRDDTLIHCRSVTADGDLGKPRLVRLRDHARGICRRLSRAGFTLVVVSNQGGVARGRYSEGAVHTVNAELNRQLGGIVEAFYFCPFHPRGVIPRYTREHPWRKPAPGMLHAAAADLGLDLASSWMVGDALRDCQAGQAAGCRTVLLGRPADGADPSVDAVAGDLREAAALILGDRAEAPA